MADTDVKTNKELIKSMFGVGAHYGYSKARRHPSTAGFIFGMKNKVEIFDLEKTSIALEQALSFVKDLASKNKTILFVSGKKEAKSLIEKAGADLSMPFVAGRWIGGTLTNFSEVKKRTHKLLDLKDKREKGELSKYTKKERLLIDREIDDLEIKFGGIANMKELPGAIFVVDAKQEIISVKEAKLLGIPVLALCSSDCDLEDVDYPIMGNDSAVSSINFFLSKVVEAYKGGLKKAE